MKRNHAGTMKRDDAVGERSPLANISTKRMDVGGNGIENTGMDKKFDCRA